MFFFAAGLERTAGGLRGTAGVLNGGFRGGIGERRNMEEEERCG